MFTAASPVGSTPNAAGAGSDNRIASTIAANATLTGLVTRLPANGALPATSLPHIDIAVSYQRVDVLGTNNINVTAG
jgi:hypothetical protein